MPFQVMSHAREECLFQLAIYVLESSTSRRLTYFMPPLNLIPLLCIRPIRLFLPAEDIRRVRIILLRATHLPCVAVLWAYESGSRFFPWKTNAAMTRTTSARLSRPTSMYQTRPSHHGLPHVTLSSGIDSHSRPTSRSRRFTGRGQQRPAPEDLADMLEEMERLRVQVERVSAAVGVHHRNRQ
ncbi:uncharacterized protein BDV17DRAFT_190743 [Aspergillus undulatus]|uniref:uncharacterized protein n=1 Tax=Aspergillus undulatus TaxID=1810928 RepID=UPI003CCD260D